MICVECSNSEIEQLYSEFKSKYIKLTICPDCGKIADKYIEFDNVILFLDIILLKPQAYRHLAYNMVELSVFGDSKPKYRHLSRYVVLLILFEVYLKWAYEEKSERHSILKLAVLELSTPLQYAFFILQQALERIVFCVTAETMLQTFGWNPKNINLQHAFQLRFRTCVLWATLTTSLAVKCLPIIMLIWPYEDTLMTSALVDILGFFNAIEALRNITNFSYLVVGTVVTISGIISVVSRECIMCFLISTLSSTPWNIYMEGQIVEWLDTWLRARTFIN